VTALSVGRGSTTVIALPQGGTVLYDAGGAINSDVGRWAVVPFLRARGIRRIDRVFLSHPNLDHYNGLPTLLEEIPTGPVVFNAHFAPRSPEKSPSAHLLELLSHRHHPIETPEASVTDWSMEGVRFERLWPPEQLDETPPVNETSTVLRLTYKGRSILLTGDIDRLAQEALIQKGNLHADALVAPHHGAVTTTTGAFFRAVAPKVVIQSSGERTTEMRSALQSLLGEIPLYNTADVGAVEVVIGRDGLNVHGFNSCSHP
jgi:competence protein ComEC